MMMLFGGPEWKAGGFERVPPEATAVEVRLAESVTALRLALSVIPTRPSDMVLLVVASAPCQCVVTGTAGTGLVNGTASSEVLHVASGTALKDVGPAGGIGGAVFVDVDVMIGEMLSKPAALVEDVELVVTVTFERCA